jgi:hypothetical protein
MFEFDPAKKARAYHDRVLKRLRSGCPALTFKRGDLDELNRGTYRLAIRACRVSAPLTLDWFERLPKAGARKDEILLEFDDLRDCYPDHSAHALVFDAHGDGVGDLVVHTLETFDRQAAGWYFSFKYDKVSVRIQPLRDFLSALNDIYTT